MKYNQLSDHAWSESKKQQIKKWNNNLVGTKFTEIIIQFLLNYLISAYDINICDLYITKLKITVKWNIIDQCNL